MLFAKNARAIVLLASKTSPSLPLPQMENGELSSVILSYLSDANDQNTLVLFLFANPTRLFNCSCSNGPGKYAENPMHRSGDPSLQIIAAPLTCAYKVKSKIISSFISFFFFVF